MTRADADAIVAESQYAMTARCMNPDCTQECAFEPHRRGRSELFCSTHCRQRYSRQRRSLLAEQRSLVRVLADSEIRGERRVQLRHQLSHLEWLLTRYPETSIACH